MLISSMSFCRFTRYYWGFIASVNLAGFMADQQPRPQLNGISEDILF